MNALARLTADHAAIVDSLPAGVVARDARRAALAGVEKHGLPVNRDENWRYANLRPLESLRFAPPLALTPDAIERARAILPPPLPGFDRYVVVDGLYASALSAAPGLAAGVRVEPGALDPAFAADGVDHRFGALAVAFAPEVLSVTADSGAGRDIEVLCVATAPGTAHGAYPALTVRAAPGSRLRLVERHIGIDAEPTFTNGAVDLAIGRDAEVRHVRLQQLGAQATHVETLRATIATGGHYCLDEVALGAASSRTTWHARLAERGARITYARSVAIDDTQVNDTYAAIEHAAPDTGTVEDFRGIAAGRARVAFNGHILMRPGAARSASRQSLKGLLAGPGTEVDVRPQLEIYTDDVKASHGATAGKLDEQMLFYLLSRGIDPRTARSLLKWAFLTELVARIAIPALRGEIERAFARRFTGEDAVVTQELA
ncbi:MAG: FeS cluster assembly protein SufD [Steroidobacteraceae bacterium]|nr:FeS cluster assembly protein SufD [Steroidobacteraceae bacterium]